MPHLKQTVEETNIESICEQIQSECVKALKSAEYQAILNRQNRQWKEVFDTEGQILPAMGINRKALTTHIVENMEKRFGVNLQLYDDSAKRNPIEIWPMMPRPLFGGSDPSGQTLSLQGTVATYLPNDIDDDIQQWLISDDTIDNFVNRITREHFSFPLCNEAQRQFIYADIFYSAMEYRLNDLPKASKRDEDFSNSIYVNPEFLHEELSAIFPFFKYSPAYEDITDFSVQKCSGGSISIQDEAAFPLLNDIYNDKKASDAYDELSKDFGREIISYQSLRSSSKILKACYPLYFFIYNNILRALVYKPSSVTSRVSGCKFSNIRPSMKNVFNALNVNIKIYKYNRKEKNNIDIPIHLYMIKKFNDYMNGLYKKSIITNSFNELWNGFTYKYQIIRGRSKKAFTNTFRLDCDMNLTAWLFIRYSDFFRIALMPIIKPLREKIINAQLEPILWPQNFFTAFNFNTASIHDYPKFYKQYNYFISQKGKKIYNKYRNMDVHDWIEVSKKFQQMQFNYQKNLEVVNVYFILDNFLRSINFATPEKREENYIYDEKEFKYYYELKCKIDGMSNITN